VWRFSLEEAHTGARRGFADFESLVTFIASQLDAGWPAPSDKDDCP
jgi:hypothetical protein